jgi:hypothetical protein
MKSISAIILAAVLLQSSPGFAAGEKDDAALAAILDTRRETSFAGQFSAFLLTLEPAALPAFRTSLVEGFAAKKLPNRHARRALGLTDTRWAEVDTAGFIAACKVGLKDLSAEGPLRAAIVLLEKDPDAAIRVARELNLEKLGVLNGFMLKLVDHNPARALAFYKEEAQRGRTSLLPQAMFARWAGKDPQAAWDALAGFPDPHQRIPVFRGIVASAAARKEPAIALRLIDSLGNPAEKSAVQEDLISTMARENIPLALELCRTINTAGVWKSFAGNLRARTDAETIRILLTSLPDEHRDDSMRAFFLREGYPTEPAFPNARMLPLLDDAALRREMIIAIAREKISKNHIPLPSSVLDATLAMSDEMLSEETPEPVREVLVEHILRYDPLRLLPWLFTLREAEWESYKRSLALNWPRHHLPRDIPALFADPRPRAKLIGKELAEKWLQDDPVRAFPAVVANTPELLTRWFKYETILAAREGDAKKVEAELETITDAGERQKALFGFLGWRVRNLPPAASASLVAEHLKNLPDQSHRNELLTGLALRLEEEMDNRFASIPGISPEEMNRIREIRASNLLSTGHEARAFRFWREITSDKEFFSSVEQYYRIKYFTSSSKGHPTDWASLLDLIAERPGAEEQKELLEQLAKHLLKDKPEDAGRIAAGIRKGPFADSLLAVLRRLSPEAKGEFTWANALELGLNTTEGRRVGLMAITRLAEDDPKAALATLIQTGDAAMSPEFIQTVMRGMLPSDPAAAFAALGQLPAAQAAPLLSEVMRGWAKLDPRAACTACLALQSPRKPSLLRETLDAWFRVDLPAARAWVLALPPGEDRTIAIHGLLRWEMNKSPRETAALALREFPDVLDADLARSLANALANASYELACRFMLDLDGKTSANHLRDTWATTMAAWQRGDPASARAFLKTLPSSPHADLLASGSSGQTGSQPLPDGDQPGMSTGLPPVDDLLAGRYENCALEPEEFKVLRESVVNFSGPWPRSKDGLSALCDYMMRRDMHGEIGKVLAESANGKSPEMAIDHVAPKIKECIGKYRYLEPDQLDAFLDGLAAVSPAWQDIAVTALWEGMSPFLEPDARIHPLYALALTRLPDERRAEILLRPLQGRQILPPELTDALLNPDREARRLAPLGRVVDALAKDNLDQALREAMLLPSIDADPLVRAILDAFGNQEAAKQAIAGIKNPEDQKRARAWLEVLSVSEK